MSYSVAFLYRKSFLTLFPQPDTLQLILGYLLFSFFLSIDNCVKRQPKLELLV